jgi:hypothetical protein
MQLENLLTTMKSQLASLGLGCWRTGVRAKAKLVARTLKGRRDQLRLCRQTLASLRNQVRIDEARIVALTTRVEAYLYVRDGSAAWRHALELDEVRQRLQNTRGYLRRALQEESRYLDGIRNLRQRLVNLHHRLAGL